MLDHSGLRSYHSFADCAFEGAAELRAVDPEAAGGRGLVLVGALSDAWGAESTAQGTTVWCELTLPQS